MSAPSSSASSCSSLPTSSSKSADWLPFSRDEWRAMEELPACCSGSRKQLCVDIDETVHGGKKVAELWGRTAPVASAVPAPQTAATPVAPVAAPTAGTSSFRWVQKLPKPHVSMPMAALTLWTAIPGFIFSWQNHSQAQKVSDLLTKLDAALQVRTRAVLQMPSNRASLEAQRNLEAYRDTVAHSVSMQRFIQHFAGLLAGASSLLVVATLFVPALEVIALSTLTVYCTSFAVRYALWDAPRRSVENVEVTHGAGALAQAGRQLAEATRKEHRWLFQKTAGCFALYGVGAGLLTIASVHAAMTLTLVGMGALFVGMVSVTYLNNFPIKETFGKNRDLHINREQLGDTDNIYRTLGVRAKQRALLHQFDQSLAGLYAGQRQWRDTGWAVIEGVTIGWTLAMLGLWPGPLHSVQHRVRTRQLKRLQADPRTLEQLTKLGDDFFALQEQQAREAGEPLPQESSEKPPTLGAALARLDALSPEGLLDHAGHAHEHDHKHHAKGHAHGGHGCTDHAHSSALPVDWQQESVQLAGLHALRFGLKGEKDFHVGALVDHVHARSRLRAAG